MPPDQLATPPSMTPQPAAPAATALAPAPLAVPQPAAAPAIAVQATPLTPAAAAVPVTVAPEPAFVPAAGSPNLTTPAAPPAAIAGAALPAPLKARFTNSRFLNQSLELCFRIGFALVFLINAATAIVDPGSFKKLIEGNFLAQAIGHTQIMLYIIALNDAVLGILILSGWKKKYVYAWSGMWLFIVTFIKITSL